MKGLLGVGRTEHAQRVLCDVGVKRFVSRESLVALLEMHLRENLLLVGNQYALSPVNNSSGCIDPVNPNLAGLRYENKH